MIIRYVSRCVILFFMIYQATSSRLGAVDEQLKSGSLTILTWNEEFRNINNLQLESNSIPALIQIQNTDTDSTFTN
jgi:hypothetical protein